MKVRAIVNAGGLRNIENALPSGIERFADC